MLVMYLRKGLLLPLLVFYATLLLLNCVITLYRFRTTHVDPNLVINRCFYL